MSGLKLQQQVTRTRLNGCKLLEFECFQWPLWIRRVLVDPRRSPAGASPGGATESAASGFPVSALMTASPWIIF
jgi:hypothetical protein